MAFVFVAHRQVAGLAGVDDVPAANPWNPFGVRFYHPTGAPNADGTSRLVGAPADVSIWTGVAPGQNDTIPSGFKPRVTEVTSYAWRVLGGLRGIGTRRAGRMAQQWLTALHLSSGIQDHLHAHRGGRQ